jgi:membrane-associated phospholipid phosphatase
MIAMGFCFLPLDVLLAHFLMADRLPGEWRRLIHRAEFFGHTYGVAGIAITVYFVDWARRRRIPRVLACAYGAGLACGIVKLVVQRVRPCEFDFQAGVASTFRGLSVLCAGSLKELLSSAYQSLPSAHTATATALALALGRLYPHARGWFITIAVIVAIGRVDGGAHFASDVWWGAAVGYATAWLLLDSSSWGRWFDRLESQRPSISYNEIPRFQGMKSS